MYLSFRADGCFKRIGQLVVIIIVLAFILGVVL